VVAARLEALRRRPGDELIVADNRITQPAHRRIGAVDVHAAGAVRSPGFARNRGAARAGHEWLVFVDSDTDPEPTLLDAYFAPPPGAGTAVIAGAIDDRAAGDGIAARYAVARAQMDQRVTLGRPAFAYAQTANCMFRRAAFTAVGGFDESIRAGEDADLCFRLGEAGWALEARPAAVVGHLTRATVAGSLRQLLTHGAGAGWCNRRHPGSFPPPRAAALAARIARATGHAASARARGDREEAAFAALDAAGALAFELGRLLPNRARR
jgi:hypothetical protein